MNLDRLCLHTQTLRPWPLATTVDALKQRGIPGISIWQQAVHDLDKVTSALIIKEAGLEVVSYVRGGFFPSVDKQKRASALEMNRQMIEEAALLGAPLLVLVCGADPGQSLQISVDQIRDGIIHLLPLAHERGVKLAVEPLHPMYADTRSAIVTLSQANDLAEQINDPYLGVALDVYHTWWDPDLQSQIYRCGKNEHLFAYHICDWNVPTTDMLNDRGLMGEGCIPIRTISSWVEEAGFTGPVEVEIFSTRYWAMDQNVFLDKIVTVFLEL